MVVVRMDEGYGAPCYPDMAKKWESKPGIKSKPKSNQIKVKHGNQSLKVTMETKIYSPYKIQNTNKGK